MLTIADSRRVILHEECGLSISKNLGGGVLEVVTAHAISWNVLSVVLPDEDDCKDESRMVVACPYRI